MTDLIHRFIFDDFDIRGEIVHLDETTTRMIQGHGYPQPLEDLLLQASAVSVLLATTLKFEGKISLQLLAGDLIKMLVVQTSHKLGIRGLVRFDTSDDYANLSFEQVAKVGHMSITIEPLKGKRYQGIVPLVGSSLAESVESYFKHSEQLETKLWLFNSNHRVCGVLLQALPDMRESDGFGHLTHLVDTLSQDEALSNEAEILIHRLFHQEQVKYFEPEAVTFECGCSREKMLNSLNALPAKEVEEILSEQGNVEVKCEFCLTQFAFNELDIKESRGVQGNNTCH